MDVRNNKQMDVNTSDVTLLSGLFLFLPPHLRSKDPLFGKRALNNIKLPLIASEAQVVAEAFC